MTDERAEPRGSATAEGTAAAVTPDSDQPPQAGAGAGGPATPPPPGDTPPPAENGPGDTPPPYGASGFAARYGLVRPINGRYLAGVCAAIGRATNTDPVLWRVLLAVLCVFGGLGLLIYLAAWLLIPSEGDSASPLEALFGRGRSNTSPALVITLAVLVALMFGFIATDGFRAALLGAAVLIGGALLLNRNNDRGRAPGPGAPPRGTPPTWPSPGPAGYPPPGPGQPSGYPAAGPSAAPGTPFPPLAAPPGGAPDPAQASSYRPPFAPHGPYAPRPTYQPATPPPPPPRPAERSPLGAATFAMIFVVLGAVTALDVGNVLNVPPAGYIAAALAVVGIGLLVGTWFGRARWLIALGVVLSVALSGARLADNVDRIGPGRSTVWHPSSYSELAKRYENNFGNGDLNLSDVDFVDHSTEIEVTVNAGNLEVILPPNVDVRARVDVNAGDATVFDERWGGFGSAREVNDYGSDGPGGGELRLTVHVNAGNVEVHR